MTRSFECPDCSRRYPPNTSYKRCVVCRDADGYGRETVHSDDTPSLSHIEAQELNKRWREFERRYAQHKERRKRLGFGDPDAIGAMEGRKWAAFWRGMEEAVSGDTSQAA